MKILITFITLFLGKIIFAQTIDSTDSSAIKNRPIKENINKVYDYPDQMPNFLRES